MSMGIWFERDQLVETATARSQGVARSSTILLSSERVNELALMIDSEQPLVPPLWLYRNGVSKAVRQGEAR